MTKTMTEEEKEYLVCYGEIPMDEKFINGIHADVFKALDKGRDGKYYRLLEIHDRLCDQAKLAHTLMANVKEVLGMEPEEVPDAIPGEDNSDVAEGLGRNQKLAEIQTLLRRGL